MIDADASALPAPPPLLPRVCVSLAVAAIAFLLYRLTLLPGVDFGDTASLQALVGEPAISPRDAYPLYFALTNLVARLAGGEPAFGINLASAISGALACGVLTWIAADLTGSLVAAGCGGLLLASSYTFWTQCIIAEVYALHLLLMGLVLAALLWWDRQRTRSRLAVVFAVYALSFGNHLMTVLMAPAIILFVMSAPGGTRLLFSLRTIALALIIAAAGASQYVWNASYLWALPAPPASLYEGLRTFWFDVTKTDWRETMVMAVHRSVLTSRASMYGFDLLQQFGAVGIGITIAGLLALLARPRLLLLIASAWIVPFVFAYTYNVGDAHVFFLPSHQIVALCAAFGAAGLLGVAGHVGGQRGAVGTMVASALLLAYPAWRAWDTWPAVDRHEDTRPLEWMSSVASGLGERDVLLGDVNWQLENGFDYYKRHVHRELTLVRATDAILTLPFLVRDNLAEGRAVYATPMARDLARTAYGDALTFEPDPVSDVRPLAARLAALRPGTTYVLAVLSPYPDIAFDAGELHDATRFLTGGTAILGREPSYTVIAGVVGQRPLLDRRADFPWRQAVAVNGIVLDVRMESWLASDTIRRAGFGQVVARHGHVLILERGVSVVALDASARPLLRTYASSLFAPLPRYRVGLRQNAAGQGPP